MTDARLRRLLLLGLLPLLTACPNAGSDRVLSIGATGMVTGAVYFDVDGSREPDQPPDSGLAGIKVSLILHGTHDTAARANTDANGAYRFAGIPVGTYDIQVDSSTFGDSVSVVKQDSTMVTVHPNDTLTVVAAVSYPIVTVAEAKALPPGKRVFIAGVLLVQTGTFSDTTAFLSDPTGSIRGTNVVPSSAFAGDSVRFLGRTAVRDSLTVLDRVRIFDIGFVVMLAPLRITSAEAATANGGVLDAALVKIATDTITDTLTDGFGNYTFTADDGTGPVTVVLDQNISFTQSRDTIGAVVDVTGLLVPQVPGTWILKPRSNADIVLR